MDRANVSGSCADDNCMATRTTATTIGTRITLVSLLFGRWTRGTDFHIERITQSLHEIRSRALAPHAHEDGLRVLTDEMIANRCDVEIFCSKGQQNTLQLVGVDDQFSISERAFVGSKNRNLRAHPHLASNRSAIDQYHSPNCGSINPVWRRAAHRQNGVEWRRVDRVIERRCRSGGCGFSLV